MACRSSRGPPGRGSPHEGATTRETRDQTQSPKRVGSILHGAWRPYAGPRQGQGPPLPAVALDWPPRGAPCQIVHTTPKAINSETTAPKPLPQDQQPQQETPYGPTEAPQTDQQTTRKERQKYQRSKTPTAQQTRRSTTHSPQRPNYVRTERPAH